VEGAATSLFFLSASENGHYLLCLIILMMMMMMMMIMLVIIIIMFSIDVADKYILVMYSCSGDCYGGTSWRLQRL